MEDPGSANALFVDIGDEKTLREVCSLLDEVGVSYRVVSGNDWRGEEPPWLFFSERYAVYQGMNNIRRIVNHLWWNKAILALNKLMQESTWRAWIGEPNQLLEGKTPQEAYREGNAKQVYGVVQAVREGVYF